MKFLILIAVLTTHENCPVFPGETIEVSSTESGVIARMDAQRNARVFIGVPIAQLDTSEARQGIRSAEIQLMRMLDFAGLEYAIKFYELDVLERTKDLENHKQIPNSVGGSEIWRREIAVSKSKASLEQAKAKLRDAKSQADQQKVELAALRDTLARRTVRAPANCVVTSHPQAVWELRKGRRTNRRSAGLGLRPC